MGSAPWRGCPFSWWFVHGRGGLKAFAEWTDTMTTQDPEEVSGDGAENRADPRLTSLEDRLKAAQRAESELTAHKEVGNAFTGKGASQGNRVLSVLLGSPLGGLVIGFALDRVLGTSPKIMLGLLVFGIVAGFVQVLRISRERAD